MAKGSSLVHSLRTQPSSNAAKMAAGQPIPLRPSAECESRFTYKNAVAIAIRGQIWGWHHRSPMERAASERVAAEGWTGGILSRAYSPSTRSALGIFLASLQRLGSRHSPLPDGQGIGRTSSMKHGLRNGPFCADWPTVAVSPGPEKSADLEPPRS
jgi:hypothetical protein